MMKQTLSSFHLKYICVSMMIVGEVLRQFVYQFTIGSGVEPLLWQTLLYHVGYFLYLGAFPIAGFLLVEGAKKTSNKRNFLRRLFSAGLLVELPIDIAIHGFEASDYWGYQLNYFFTLFLSLCVICLAEKIAEWLTAGSFWYNLITILIYLASAVLAMLFQMEQGGLGVLVILALYVFYENKVASLISVIVLYLLFFKGVGVFAVIPALSLLFLWLYKGEEGKKTVLSRMCFYFAYPVVFVIIEACMKFL